MDYRNRYPVNFSIWRDRRPETYKSLTDLHRRGIKCAVAAGTLAFWHGVRYRLSDESDTDLLAHGDHFQEAVGVLRAETDRCQFSVPTGHGVSLLYEGVRATALRDGQLIEIIQPLSPAYLGDTELNIGLSDLAVPACTEYDGVLAAHPYDTIALKTILWRQQMGKNDMNDAYGLAAQLDPRDSNYIVDRSIEMGILNNDRTRESVVRMLPFIEMPALSI